MLQILVVIAPLFLVIFVAALYQRARQLGDEWERVLNEFTLKITFPALLFSILARANLSFQHELGLLIVNSVYVIGGLFAGYLLARLFQLSAMWQRTLFASLVIGNTAYLGFPVLERLHGPTALAEASLIVAVYMFWMFTIGISFLEISIHKKKRRLFATIAKKLIRNPLLVTVVFSLLVAGLHIPVPNIVMEGIDLMAASVIPVVLVVIGLFMGKSRLGHIREWIPVLLFSLTTLLVLPALLYFGIPLFGYSTDAFSVTIIEAAMPLAILPFALADEYKLNKIFISRSIVLSTILSVITLPFWISLFN